MNTGIRTIIYPVKDLTKAKAQFGGLLGVKPYVDQAYYVGFSIGDQQIGLVPASQSEGMTAFFHVDNIRQSLQSLLDAGAQTLEEVKDVGGGKLVGSVKDTDGNIIGLIQEP